MKPNRSHRQTSIDARMEAAQIETLKHWLTSGGLTYIEAKERMMREWCIKASLTWLSGFYRRHCDTTLDHLSARPASTSPPSNELVLDLVVRAIRPVRTWPVRIRVSNRGGRLIVVTCANPYGVKGSKTVKTGGGAS